MSSRVRYGGSNVQVSHTVNKWAAPLFTVTVLLIYLYSLVHSRTQSMESGAAQILRSSCAWGHPIGATLLGWLGLDFSRGDHMAEKDQDTYDVALVRVNSILAAFAPCKESLRTVRSCLFCGVPYDRNTQVTEKKSL